MKDINTFRAHERKSRRQLSNDCTLPCVTCLTEVSINLWEFLEKPLREALLSLRPEIYGSIAEEKVELNGLLYVIERLPVGIEQCRYINLTSDEGYANSHFKAIVPPKEEEIVIVLMTNK